MGKKYELDIQTMCEIGIGSTIGYFSYGHHDEDEFLRNLIESYSLNDDDKERIKRGTKYLYVKAVPYCGTSEMMFTFSKEPKKYFKPITLYEF